MTPQLKALLVAVGLAFAGTTAYTLYVPGPGVDKNMLIDAGINAGTSKDALCRVWCESDGGIAYRYARTKGVLFNADRAYDTSTKFVPDGCHPFKLGYDPTANDGGGLPIYDCKPAPTNTLGAGVDEQDEPDECACDPALPDGGVVVSTCEYLAPDGGWVTAPPRMNMPAGAWRGACINKPCAEIAGATTWPAGCGPE